MCQLQSKIRFLIIDVSQEAVVELEQSNRGTSNRKQREGPL